jgi:hypothetical protein
MRDLPTHLNFAFALFVCAACSWFRIASLSPYIAIPLTIAVMIVLPRREIRDVIAELLIVSPLLFGGFAKHLGIPPSLVAFVFAMGGGGLLILDLQAPNKARDVQLMLVASIVGTLVAFGIPYIFCHVFADRCAP